MEYRQASQRKINDKRKENGGVEKIHSEEEVKEKWSMFILFLYSEEALVHKDQTLSSSINPKAPTPNNIDTPVNRDHSEAPTPHPHQHSS